MSFRFRPRLDALEAREVPAGFSAALPNGTVVSGQFSTPAGVDPAQSSQSLSLGDLSVVKGGTAYTVQPGASAQYTNGTLVGVTGYATLGSDVVYLYSTSVHNGSYTAPLALDGADTRDTFQFSNGTVGALSYTIPWDQVDPTQASQSLTPTAFNLNIAGQNFAYGSASYTTAPTLVFAYGDFVGVSFSLTPPSGFAYTSVSGSFDINGDNIITGIQAGTGQQFFAAAAPKTTALTVQRGFRVFP